LLWGQCHDSTLATHRLQAIAPLKITNLEVETAWNDHRVGAPAPHLEQQALDGIGAVGVASRLETQHVGYPPLVLVCGRLDRVEIGRRDRACDRLVPACMQIRPNHPDDDWVRLPGSEGPQRLGAGCGV